jgi:hypothetical protein
VGSRCNSEEAAVVFVPRNAAVGNPVLLLKRRRRRVGDDGYGAAAIIVYDLNRESLIRERIERLTEMQAVSCVVVDALIDVGAATAQDRPLRLERLRSRRAYPDSFANANKPYAATWLGRRLLKTKLPDALCSLRIAPFLEIPKAAH